MDKLQKEVTEESTIYQLQEILKSYKKGYNYKNIINAVKIRIELSEGMLK